MSTRPLRRATKGDFEVAVAVVEFDPRTDWEIGEGVRLAADLSWYTYNEYMICWWERYGDASSGTVHYSRAPGRERPRPLIINQLSEADFLERRNWLEKGQGSELDQLGVELALLLA